MIRWAALAIAAVALGGAAWLAFADSPRPTWQLIAPDSIELAPGGSGSIQVDVVPASGRTVSRDGPLRIEVVAPDGITVGRRRLSLADAADPGAAAPRFAIKLTADRAGAGSYPVELEVRLWLCLKQTCKPVKATRTVTVVVNAPPTPDAAPPPPDAAPSPDARKKRPRAK